MRDWDSQSDEIEAANAVVYILTPDAPDVVERMVARKNFTTPVLSVSPDVWAQWGITNDKKPKVPHPSTFVIAPDGTLTSRVTHTDYTKRADVHEVLAGLPQPRVPEQGPDWDAAMDVSATGTASGVRLTVVVAEGFHVYGAKEKTARPLQVRVDGRKRAGVRIPRGERKALQVGEAWVLEGTIHLDLPAKAPAAGDLDVQLCTDTACSPPQTLRWSVGPPR